MPRHISAADIEKYGYCPLSFWLSWREERVRDPHLQDGKERHEDIASSVSKAKLLETRALTTEKLVLWYAVIATIIAIFGIDLLPFPYEETKTVPAILVVVSLIWVLAALIFLNMAFRTPVRDKVLQYEKIILIFAVVAALVAVNSVLFSWMSLSFAIILEVVSLIWLIAATFFLQRSLTFSRAARELKKDLHIHGKIEYVDLEGSELLTSDRFGISGRPDYVIQVEGSMVPVEEKTGRTPRGPLFSHILQVAAYCLLIEEKIGKPVPFGILKYGPDQHMIDFDEGLRNILLTKIEEMREITGGRPAHRNHNRPNKCASCSRREICPEKLV